MLRGHLLTSFTNRQRCACSCECSVPAHHSWIQLSVNLKTSSNALRHWKNTFHVISQWFTCSMSQTRNSMLVLRARNVSIGTMCLTAICCSRMSNMPCASCKVMPCHPRILWLVRCGSQVCQREQVSKNWQIWWEAFRRASVASQAHNQINQLEIAATHLSRQQIAHCRKSNSLAKMVLPYSFSKMQPLLCHCAGRWMVQRDHQMLRVFGPLSWRCLSLWCTYCRMYINGCDLR